MKELVWTKELSVGNATIDSDHKQLIDMTNRIRHEIRAANSSALAQAFERIENWLPVHFANEEKVAQAVHFPLDQHKLSHQYSMKELQHIREELVSREGIWSEGAVEHFCHFLENWAIEHITKMDMQMKPALQTHSYDFQHG